MQSLNQTLDTLTHVIIYWHNDKYTISNRFSQLIQSFTHTIIYSSYYLLMQLLIHAISDSFTKLQMLSAGWSNNTVTQLQIQYTYNHSLIKSVSDTF